MKVIHIELRLGQTMQIGPAYVSLEEKSGQRARLKIEAPPSMKVEPPSKTDSGAAKASKGVLTAALA